MKSIIELAKESGLLEVAQVYVERLERFAALVLEEGYAAGLLDSDSCAEAMQADREWVEPSDELLNDILMRYTKTEFYKDDLCVFRAVLKLAKELNMG